MSAIKVIRGDTYTINVTSKDASGNVIDITDATLFFTLKRRHSDTDDEALIAKDITVHTNPTQGMTSVLLSNDDTDIDPGVYYWDVQLKEDDGTITSRFADQLIIVADITRRIS